MKKIFALLLSVMLILSLAACDAGPAFVPSISHAPTTVSPTAAPADTPSPQAASPTPAPTATASPPLRQTPGNLAEHPSASPSATEKATGPQEAPPRSETVYWTPSGKVYHTTPDCGSLAKSKMVLEGTAEESGKARVCKLCG